MKKLLLHFNALPQLLIYSGLALMVWPGMLRSLDLIAYGSTFSTLSLYAGLLLTLAGIVLRLYQQQLMGENALRDYLIRFLIGLAIVALLMATGVVRTPAFLQQLF